MRPRSTLGTKRVLVVDDEPEVSELLSDLLRLEGYEVDQAENGSAALYQLNEELRRDSD